MTRRFLLGLGALAWAVACKGGSTGPNDSTTLAFTTGQGQSGQVATTLPVSFRLRASDTRGPIANATIAMAVQPQAGGLVSPQTATTGADGTAQFTWTLGKQAGAQTLTASMPGKPAVRASITATATPGPATLILPASATSVPTVVGHAVAVLPTVTVSDEFNNPIAEVPVTFELLQGASFITGTGKLTDAQGHASLGSWTIGPDAVSYSVRARIPAGAVAVFEARGIPAAFALVTGSGQTTNVGTVVPVVPAVRVTRDDGSPLPNVAVDFSVTDGGGSVAGSPALSGADGIARPLRWVVGNSPGANRLEASTLGRSTLTFNASATTAVPAFAVASSATQQMGILGNYLAASPEVTVTDAQGKPVSLVTVTFQVTEGDGQLTRSSSQTDFLGRAGPTSWRLGSSPQNSLIATSGSFPTIVFTATGTPPPASTFRIEVRYAHRQPTDAQRAAFDAAAARWTQLLLAGGAPYMVRTGDDQSCGNVRGEIIDGVVIFAEFEPVDGPFNILGFASPCILRDERFLPVVGIMFFDTFDLPRLEGNGTLNAVILHEMAHVLGFAPIWNLNRGAQGVNAFLDGVQTGDPTFNGPAARAAFYGSMAPGTFFSGVPVPVESGGGSGTANKHWRETTFSNELMTGFLNSGSNPLSAMTVQQFRDLGYLVNDVFADSYTFQAALRAAGAPLEQLIEGELPGPMLVIDRQGRVVGRVARQMR